jgi:HEAT repeat protein
MVCVLALPAILLAEAEGLEAELAILRDKNVQNDGASLLAFFKKRTMSEATRKKVAGLIQLLGDEEFAVREKATTDLIEIGAAARPMLSAALRDTDLEVRRRARRALEAIGPAAGDMALLPAAARLLAHRKPPGTAEVLLEFLPNIEDTDLAEEIARIVGKVALDKTGKPEPAVLLALSDRQWIKRYAAAEALAGIAGQRPTVRKLLKDRDNGVRRRVALALLHAHDKEAVPALIELLTADTREDAGAAEDVLMALAGDKSPSPPDEDHPVNRERYRKQWESWWKEAGATFDLAKIDFANAGHGYTLMATMDQRAARGRMPLLGRVQELDRSGKVSWTISDLNYPIHARKTRRDRVLVCEYRTRMVTERDLKGKVLWEKRLDAQPVSAQRLANGNTFIATRTQLLEVDRSGREVKVIPRLPGGFILAAERYKDGRIAIITSTGQYFQLDREGRQIKSFSIRPAGLASVVPSIGLKCDFRPDGGVIVPDSSHGELREYDAQGKLIWRKTLPGFSPTSVTRLANGHTLVGSMNSNRIVELNKEGKEVSSKTVEGRLMFLDRR